MSKLSYTNVLDLTDNVAATHRLIALGLGDGTNYGSQGGANFLAAVLALDESEQELALLSAADILAGRSKTAGGAHLFFPEVMRSLMAHLNGIGEYMLEQYLITDIATADYTIGTQYIDRFSDAETAMWYDASAGTYSWLNRVGISAVDTGAGVITLDSAFSPVPTAGSDYLVIADRVAPEIASLCKKFGFPINALSAWSPVTVLGDFTASGAAAGTYTAGETVDTGLYGPADLEVVVTVEIGANDLVLAITGTDQDGAEATGAVTVPNGSVVDTAVDVTPDVAGTRFTAVTDITNSNGTAADAVDIQTKEDRTPNI